MAERFVTTNVRLPADLHRRLKRRSAEEGKGIGEMVREAVNEYMAARDPQVSLEDGSRDPFFAVAGIGDSGLGNGAERHDDYLYRPRTPDGAKAGKRPGPGGRGG